MAMPCRRRPHPRTCLGTLKRAPSRPAGAGAQAMAHARGAAAGQDAAAALPRLAAAAATSAALHAACAAAALALSRASQARPATAPAALAAAVAVTAATLARTRGPPPGGGRTGSGTTLWRWHAAVLLAALCAGLAATACLNWAAALVAALLAGPSACWVGPRRWATLLPLALAGALAAAAGGPAVLGAHVWRDGVRTTAFWVAALVCAPCWLHCLHVVRGVPGMGQKSGTWLSQLFLLTRWSADCEARIPEVVSMDDSRRE